MTKTTPKLVGILAGTLITLAAFGTSAIEKAAGAGPPLANTAASQAHLGPSPGTLHSVGRIAKVNVEIANWADVQARFRAIEAREVAALGS